MRVFHGIATATELRGPAVCLGNFDGVHLGHQALFAASRALGTPVAFTFQPHPGKVLSPQLAPKLITLLPRKLELMAHYGIEAAIVQPFDLSYARTSPEEFERDLFERLGAKAAVVGGDFTYGSKRAGTVETLARAAKPHGAVLRVVPHVTVEGVQASSSHVREYILEGRVSAARQLLGRWFDLDGQVVRGQGRGQTIGFPTANVDTQNELRPAPGVYAVRVRLIDTTTGQPEGAGLTGAANIGVKPTFGGGEVTIEVHLLEWSGDLYGRSMRVQFIERLRSEQRFASVEELKVQIGRDVEAARAAVAAAVDEPF